VGSFRQALNRTLVLPGFWYARTGVLDGKVRQRSRLGQHDHKANQKDMNLEPVGLFFDLAAMKSLGAENAFLAMLFNTNSDLFAKTGSG
jgi:hypothetical protein